MICPNCKKKISVDSALMHQFKAQILASSEERHKKELEDAVKLAKENEGNKIQEEFKLQLSKLQKENEEEKERNMKLLGQMNEMLDEIKQLRNKDEERDLEMKKKMLEQEDKIRQEERKKATEENQLKSLETEKKLQDVLKINEELKRKLEQGSQQTQGEVLELELERILKTEFPEDVINEVKKGERGADVVHEVIDKRGRSSGVILWETKNAQWKNDWPAKLKGDQRDKKSDLAVLVTVNKPAGMDTFIYREGIWITTWKFVIPLAFILRYSLIKLNHEKEKVLNQDKSDQKEILYQYFTGTEFQYRLEAIVDAFNNLQNEEESEKRWFNAKWGRQEKNLRKVLDQTCGMYGDLQGIIGRSLPEIKTLELPEKIDSVLISSDDNQ